MVLWRGGMPSVSETPMFEQHPKVLYGKNVLEEVLCQLRFPEILKIDAELPSGFQERIRAEFPLYSPTEAPTLPIQIQQFVKIANPQQARRFDSANGQWSVSLAGGFIALTTKSYTRWSDFQTRLEGPLRALCEEYRPS